MTADLAASAVSVTAAGDRLDHIYCCNPDRALCGTDVSNMPEIDDANCVVCLALEEQPCPDCGSSP